MALHSKRVKKSRPGEQGMISGGQDTGQDDGIHDASGSICARHLKDNGEWRCVRVAGVEV